MISILAKGRLAHSLPDSSGAETVHARKARKQLRKHQVEFGYRICEADSLSRTGPSVVKNGLWVAKKGHKVIFRQATVFRRMLKETAHPTLGYASFDGKHGIVIVCLRFAESFDKQLFYPSGMFLFPACDAFIINVRNIRLTSVENMLHFGYGIFRQIVACLAQ
jgi:hypothetical protein